MGNIKAIKKLKKLKKLKKIKTSYKFFRYVLNTAAVFIFNSYGIRKKIKCENTL